MLRKIISAIKAAFRFLRRLASVPGRMIGAMLGAGGVEYIEDDDAPELSPALESQTVDNSVVHRAERERLALQTAASCVRTYAADAQVDLVRPPLPPAVPRIMREWLGGLSYSELQMLTDAAPAAVASHISSGPYIIGLFRVCALPPVTLVRPEAADHKAAWLRDGDVLPSRVESCRVRW